jgi:hypothetical protein
MSLPIAFASLLSPALLLIAPVSLSIARDCMDWSAAAQAMDSARKNCPRPPFMPM